jgi:hypothetical protein
MLMRWVVFSCRKGRTSGEYQKPCRHDPSWGRGFSSTPIRALILFDCDFLFEGEQVTSKYERGRSIMRLAHPLRWFLSVSILAAILFSQQLVSQSQSVSSSNSDSTATTKPKPDPGKASCTNNGTYVNSKGQTVNRPENCSNAPKGATAQCHDGTYSFSQSRRGTCSRHGGVAKWL